MSPASSSPAGEFLVLRLIAQRWSSSLERQLGALAPGGIVLAPPFPGSPDDLRELVREITRCLPSPPILAVDAGPGEEPLGALLPSLPSPRALASEGVPAVRSAGELIGEALNLLGFNTHFAPALDLTSAFADSRLDPGTFGTDPHVVAQCGAAFLAGLTRHKILACGKHFPGLASVPPPVHHELPTSLRPMAELWRRDLAPFRELLPRLPMVMMSTAAYKAYDFDYPRSAVLSAQVVRGLLRSKLGYRGLVVASQLESPAVRGALDLSRAAVESIYSGCDMLLVESEGSWQGMRRGIDQVFTLGRLDREPLEQSLSRIRAVKKGCCSPPKGPFARRAWERLARRFQDFRPRV